MPQHWIVEVQFSSANDPGTYAYSICAERDTVPTLGTINEKPSMICEGKSDGTGKTPSNAGALSNYELQFIQASKDDFPDGSRM
jgi:hypothetical protein